MRALSTIFTLALLVFTAACGGSEEAPPTPLAKHIDDMHIAAIPLDQKQTVVQTQQDWSVAKMESAKAEADLNEMNAKLDGAKNDHAAAKLTVNTALSNKKQADASSDTNRINAAERELRGAEMGVKAAEKRVKYFEAYRNYLKRLHIYAQHNMYWRESQYELSKAQLAQKNNIAPKGVSFDAFPSQEADRNKKTASAKQKSDAELGKAQNAREEWLKLQAQADEAMGKKSQLSDPMAPKGPAPTTAAPAPAAQ
jgi:hypothetical protein